jgi:hypothetical protein
VPAAGCTSLIVALARCWKAVWTLKLRSHSLTSTQSPCVKVRVGWNCPLTRMTLRDTQSGLRSPVVTSKVTRNGLSLEEPAAAAAGLLLLPPDCFKDRMPDSMRPIRAARPS